MISFMAGRQKIVLPFRKWIAFNEPAGSEKNSMTFNTRREAEDHILKAVKACDYCKKAHRGRDSMLYESACGAEWNVLKTVDFMKADTFEEYLEACGYKKVDPKEFSGLLKEKQSRKR